MLQWRGGCEMEMRLCFWMTIPWRSGSGFDGGGVWTGFAAHRVCLFLLPFVALLFLSRFSRFPKKLFPSFNCGSHVDQSGRDVDESNCSQPRFHRYSVGNLTVVKKTLNFL